MQILPVFAAPATVVVGEGRNAEEPPQEGLKANPPLEIAKVLASCLEGHVLFASHLRLLYHR